MSVPSADRRLAICIPTQSGPTLSSPSSFSAVIKSTGNTSGNASWAVNTSFLWSDANPHKPDDTLPKFKSYLINSENESSPSALSTLYKKIDLAIDQQNISALYKLVGQSKRSDSIINAYTDTRSKLKTVEFSAPHLGYLKDRIIEAAESPEGHVILSVMQRALDQRRDEINNPPLMCIRMKSVLPN